MALENDVGLGRNELQDDPGQFTVLHEQVGATAQEFVGDLVFVEKLEQARNAFVVGDAEQIGRAADAQRGPFRELGGGPQLNAEFRQLCEQLAIVNTHVPRDRSEEHTSELQSQSNLVCRLLLEKKKKKHTGAYALHVSAPDS